MTGGVLFSYILPLVVVALVAAISGGLTAWWLLHRQHEADEPRSAEPAADQSDDADFIDAEIDIAAVKWAEDNHLPSEAAGLMAGRLKTLHEIGKGKGWF